MADEGVGEGLGAPLRHRPPDDVAGQPEHEPERRRSERLQRDRRVRRDAGEERARVLPFKPAVGKCAGRADRLQPEAGQHERVLRQVQHRLQDLVGEVGPRLHEGPGEGRVGLAVHAQPLRRPLNRLVKRRRVPVRDRLGHRDVRADPRQPVLFEGERLEERRGRPEGVDRRADVVDEAGPRQLRRARGAARRGVPLQHEHAAARLRHPDRGGQPVRPGADDDGVVVHGEEGKRGRGEEGKRGR